jgi:methyl-accepting chemotaxis protein
MKINLRLKLVIGYTLMAILLIICGVVGYLTTLKMSQQQIDFQANQTNQVNQAIQANNALHGVLQISSSIREQVRVADNMLSGGTNEVSQNLFPEALQRTEQALQSMVDARQIPQQQIDQIVQAQQSFTAAFNSLMESYQQHQIIYQQTIDNAELFKNILSSFNERAKRIIVEKETNWDISQSNNTRQIEEWFAASASNEAELALFSQLYYLQQLLNGKNIEQIQALIKNSQTDLDIYMDDLSAMQLSKQLADDSDKSFSTWFAEYYAQHKNLYAQTRENLNDLQIRKNTFESAVDKLLQQTVEIEQASSKITTRNVENNQQINNPGYFNIMITVIIGIVLAIITFTLTLRSVVSPVRKITDQLHKLSKNEGDLSQQLMVTCDDELSELSISLNHFIQQVRQQITQLIPIVEQLAKAVSDLSGQSQQTQQQMLAQQSATDSVNLNMHDMALHVEDVFQAAQHADNSMQTMKTTLQQSQQVISGTLDSMNDFASDIESASAVIEQLNNDSQQVGSVVDVIQSISEQTNLLALNAAIEAARAGDQGRGFAVVADEVRTLASRTKQSTTEIQAIIERLQKGSEQAARVMTRSREKSQLTMSTTGSASESLSSITDNFQSTGDIISKITTAASSQNEKTHVMQQNLDNISDINTQTSSSYEQMSDITLKLNDLASQLQQLMGHFKV